MHHIEPYYNWRYLYAAEEDKRSPFFGRTYNEFEYSQTIYNYYIHPHWDDFGSKTLYVKVLFADYDQSFCIIELIGEWNDAIENDIMMLKREVVDDMIRGGIHKFILIGENVLNFHHSDSCYYEEWQEDVADEGGWVVMIGLPRQSQEDFIRARINRYVELLELPQWRTVLPQHLFAAIDTQLMKRLNG